MPATTPNLCFEGLATGIAGNFEAGGHLLGIAIRIAGNFKAGGKPIGIAIGIAGNFEAGGPLHRNSYRNNHGNRW